MNFVPRLYQTETKSAVLDFWAAGKLFPLVVAPTGSGKTEVSKMILSDFRSPMGVVHTRTLFEQTARRVPECRVYTLQGLLAKGPAGDKRRAALARHDVVWFDEAHHLGGEEWRAVLALPTLPQRRFGVTATPMRADGTALGDFFDCFHVAAQYSQLVAAGHLVRCDVIRSDISRKEQKKDKVRPDGVAAYIEHGRRDDGTWRPGIHFEVTVEACESAVTRYRESGVRAELITNTTPTDERRRIFDRYSAGDIDMLCSPTVLAEGFDAPCAEICVLRRSCDHLGDAIQRWGRVLRPFAGIVGVPCRAAKVRGLLIDITNVTTKKGFGLPTDDRVYSLEGKGIRLQAEVDEEAEKPALPAPTPFQTVQAGYQLVRDTLLSRYRDLQAQAEEYGYKSGWIFHRFTEATSIPPPRMFPAKFRSVCIHCRKRLEIGETMFWMGTSQVFHEECWIASLDGERLEAASIALESATAWKPSRTRRVAEPIDDDSIPF